MFGHPVCNRCPTHSRMQDLYQREESILSPTEDGTFHQTTAQKMPYWHGFFMRGRNFFLYSPFARYQTLSIAETKYVARKITVTTKAAVNIRISFPPFADINVRVLSLKHDS